MFSKVFQSILGVSFWLVFLPMSEGRAGAHSVAPGDPPADLVEGVQQLVSPGSPGPVYGESTAWTAIVQGDEDASFPSTFVAARGFGAGRVLICGHDGIVVNPGLLDNGRFLVNAARFLDVAGARRVLYTVSHGEWAGAGRLNVLGGMLANEGFTLEPLAGRISQNTLGASSVLIVGNAWAAFTDAEIEAVHRFVENGGGLFMFGLGWSWPGNFDDYPMMRLAQPFEARWLRSVITDPIHNFNGSPIFSHFYPNTVPETPGDAMTAIRDVHEHHPADLPLALETDDALRLRFLRSHQVLALSTRELAPDDARRREIFDFCTKLITRFPAYYERSHVFSPGESTSAWLRERFWLTWRDALIQAAETASTVAPWLSETRRKIFERSGVLLMDNSMLDDRQLEYINNFFGQLPPELHNMLHNMHGISVTDFLGPHRFDVNAFFAGAGGSVNIFGIGIGGYAENPFPDDISQAYSDGFAIVVAHEMNHVVDAYAIWPNPTLAAREIELVRHAGLDDLNFLRSMVGGAFFQQNPQEFFASIANQWFTDSARTLELGLSRFARGRPEPLNQALFFTEVYSRGSGASRFYRMDTTAHLESFDVPVHRNERGQIDQLVLEGRTYVFDRDDAGNVLAVDVN